MVDWLVGGYYANEKLTLRDNIRFGADYGAFAACRLLAGAGASPSPLLSAGLLDPDAAGCMTTPARPAMTACWAAIPPCLKIGRAHVCTPVTHANLVCRF